MLIRFNVKNFLSFNTRDNDRSQEFSMLAGKVRNKSEHIYYDKKIKLLKFAAIYGANASGKSNLVKAIKFMKLTVVDQLPQGHTEKYCKTDIGNQEKPSYFEIELLIDEKYYSYGFEIILSQSKFISEWLVELNDDNSEKIIFERDIVNRKANIGSIFKEKKLRQKMEFYIEDIVDDTSALFLNIMNKNKKNLYEEYESARILKKIFEWIGNSLNIHYPSQPISNYSYISKANNIQKICEMASALGIPISNVRLVDISIDKALSDIPDVVRHRILEEIEMKIAEIRQEKSNVSAEFVLRSNENFINILIESNFEVKCQTIEFEHEKKDVFYRLSEESDGTIRILDLLEILLVGEGKTFVIDELDRCLHPSLTYQFVRTFLRVASKQNIQLIATVHESRLLDFDLLRRDEIWFVDKNESGETDIYSLEEYNTRFDQKIDKAYLEGRYGGIPIFTTVFPI